MLCLSGFELYSRWVPLLIAGFADESDVELGEESKVTLTRIVLQLIMCISGHISHTAISITVKVVSSFWLH